MLTTAMQAEVEDLEPQTPDVLSKIPPVHSHWSRRRGVDGEVRHNAEREGDGRVESEMPRLSFLTLPPEIRNQIYQFALVSSHPILVKPSGIKDWPGRGNVPIARTGITSAILGTCHQIHAEASAYLYGSNILLFSCSIWHWTHFISSIARYVHLVQHIRLPLLYSKASAPAVCTALARLTQLKTMEVYFTRALGAPRMLICPYGRVSRYIPFMAKLLAPALVAAVEATSIVRFLPLHHQVEDCDCDFRLCSVQVEDRAKFDTDFREALATKLTQERRRREKKRMAAMGLTEDLSRVEFTKRCGEHGIRAVKEI